jgi:multiple sugar transport system permease protein
LLASNFRDACCASRGRHYITGGREGRKKIMAMAKREPNLIQTRNFWQTDGFWGTLFVFPLMAGLAIFLLIPLLRSFYLGFTSYNVLEAPRFIGVQNYLDLIRQDRMFQKSFINTLVFAAGLVPCNLLLAVATAALLNKVRKWATFFRGVYFVPVITSEVVFSVVWLWIWNYDYGLANYILRMFGAAGPNWLGDSNWAMFSVIVTRLLKNLGMNVVIILAALQSIPEMYYEAAELDGAGWFNQFRHVTLPELGPVIFLTLMVTIIGAFKVFGSIYVLTGGGPAGSTNVLVMYLYQMGFKTFEYGKASAIGMIIFLMVLVFTLIQWILRKKMVYQEE